MTEQGDAFIQNGNINTTGNDLIARVSAPFLNGANKFKTLSKRSKILIIGSIVIMILITFKRTLAIVRRYPRV